MNKLKKRIVSVACAASMMLSAVSGTLFSISRATDDLLGNILSEENNDSTEFFQQSFELFPNNEDIEQIITLEGSMPDGVEAEAVDVTADYEGIAAYNITLTNGDEEYQPDENHPVFVEITAPSILEEDNIELWHIKDNGEREKIPDITVENGKLSFYATGFSVYEIVNSSVNQKSIFEKISEYGSDGLLVSYYGADDKTGLLVEDEGPYYLSGRVLEKIKEREGLEKTTNINDAIKLYFEQGSNNKQYYIYTLSGNQKKYLKMYRCSTNEARGGLTFTENESEKTLFKFEKNETDYLHVSATVSGKTYYLIENDNPIAVVGYTSSTDKGTAWLHIEFDEQQEANDSELDGKEYGLFHYTDGSTSGNALMSKGDSHSLIKLILKANGNNDVLYVDQDNEIDRWKFTAISGGKHLISIDTDEGTNYLCLDNNEISTVSDIDAAGKFDVESNSKGMLRIKSNGKYIIFDPETNGFGVTTSGSDSNVWLWALDKAALSDDDLITFSADRVSISDVQDGDKVIVYIRIWNEDELKYDMYAVDYNGSLYPCYASGGKIMWLGDGTCSLEWTFTEYLDAVTKKPNYYYELYNPYSEKYIAPQRSDSQVLSDDPIGINLQGRRNGDFYSEILAWDNSCMKYIGLRPNEDKTALESCSESTALPFYFATLEPLNLSDSLHEVRTIDNNEHGITMRMFNFDYPEGVSNQSLGNSTVSREYFNGDTSNKQKLLNNSLSYTDDNDIGYPTVSSSNKSFRDLYSDAQEVNHLFIESVYNSSGYFEFDSCQNFATLMEKNNGDFTVYRELGTTDEKSKPTLQHGQFFPYNTISAGVYSSASPLNLYNMNALASNISEGKLDDLDPRKYEDLHLIKNPDYLFGMEMSANFVQTVSGLDAWGHDIIFDFTGDDDFWFYVDGELVIDLGGCHSAEHGRVNFRTGEIVYSLVTGNNDGRIETHTTLKDVFRKNYEARGVQNIDAKLDEIFEDNGEGQYIFKDYTTHTMRIFYMERGKGASNLHMRFNLASVTPGHVVVSKTLGGEGASEINADFIEYPFQIYYTLPEGEDGHPGKEQILGNDDAHVRVTYQNSNQPVSFVSKYRPPGFTDEEAYDNVYFINPTKSSEIAFPDNTISYRIVECAVDSNVYGTVRINGEDVPPNRVEIKRDLVSYSSEPGTADSKPNISFENIVNKDVVRDLLVTKKLVDDNNNPITNDPATFSFRLYLSSVNSELGQETLANMYEYYVLSPNKKICIYDGISTKFIETDIEYSSENVKSVLNGDIEGISEDDIVFRTSGFGAISGIPAGYTICVPNLTVGSYFKITEDVKSGYGLDRYEPIYGSETRPDGTVIPIASYNKLDESQPNMGEVIAAESPIMEVINKKGYGLSVEKKWSDLDITTAHSSIYTAVYVDGELLEGSVKEIKSPSVSAYYFWTTLKPYSNGKPRTNFNGYEIKEVLLSGNINVTENGNVTGYDDIQPLLAGNKLTITSTRTSAATPADEAADKQFDYVVAYSTGVDNGSTRTDTIINNREGGIAIRLFKWASDEPLSGGTFELLDSSGNVIGNYTSASDGIITMIYNFKNDSIYTLRQTTAPKGYVGLQKRLSFKVNADETVSLYYSDGSEWGTSSINDIGWVDSKKGTNGLTAFVDVYNKYFNFKIVKTDESDHGLMLSGAHFALYKQRPTSIAGDVKPKEPLQGFEDLTTSNGEVVVCGENSGRYIDPGPNGSVYFLTETKAPFNYAKLDEDIIFHISAIGVPSMRGGVNYGRLVETDNSYIYTLSVPNVKEDITTQYLTIEKRVQGSFGDRSKEFNFTVDIKNAGDGEKIIWAKNGDEQTPMPRNGTTFSLKHNDKVEIALPVGVSVTVKENSAGYQPSFKLDEGDAVSDNKLTFVFNESANLIVTNTLNGILPLGIAGKLAHSVMLIIIPLFPIGLVIFMKKKKRYKV